MKQVLFLCTGNYYRSRFAEELFNARVSHHALSWQAISAGLDPTPLNPGPISRHTLEAFRRLGIRRPSQERFPRKVTATDFATSDLVIAVKEAEHRVMIERSFPDQLPSVEFWHVDDVDCALPAETIADLERRIENLIDRLRHLETESRQSAA